jgi:hypothetical protein
MTQTIAQQIKWNFKTNGELVIKDKNGNRIYLELSNGYWAKYEYDSQGNPIYFKNSNGFWVKNEWDFQGKLIYLEDSNGIWVKFEYDSQGNQIYYENSRGVIRGQRSKPREGKEIIIEGV